MNLVQEIQVKAEIAGQLTDWIAPAPGRRVTGAEVGVKQGRLSEQLLACIPSLTLFLVDWWRPAPAAGDYAQSGDPAANADGPEVESWLDEAIRRTLPNYARCRFVPCDSVRAARFVPDEWLDFVFLDADHSYESRLADLRAWAPKVRPLGLIAGGLFHSAFGGDCCERALREWHRETARPFAVEHGPSKTWGFRR